MVSEIFNVECKAMVDMTLLFDHITKIKVIHFGANRFLIYVLIEAVNNNFCSRVHSVLTDDDYRRTKQCSINATELSAVG